MKIYSLDFPLHKPGIDYIHYRLFHGVQAPWPHRRPAPSPVGEPYEPLTLVHNARYVPAVFAPQLMPVVSQAVADEIGDVPGAEFWPVTFHRLVDFVPPVPGDSSYQQSVSYQMALHDEHGEQNIFDYIPEASSALASRVGRYFELVPTRLSDVSHHFTDARRIRYNRPYTIDATNEINISPSLVEAYYRGVKDTH